MNKNKFTNRILRLFNSFTILLPNQGSKKYWERRYEMGENSGDGSYGRLAKFKKEVVINSFIKKNKIQSVLEFGCGDGNQLSLFKCKKYIGLDVSETAIKLCISKFNSDKSKSFFIYNPDCFSDNHNIFNAELVLSLDVIYHLIENSVFNLYMKHLFSSARKFVIIYSSNSEKNSFYNSPHYRNREFTSWVEKYASKWKLVNVIKNIYHEKTLSDFYIYKKIK